MEIVLAFLAFTCMYFVIFYSTGKLIMRVLDKN